jgi:hypothetical protein
MLLFTRILLIAAVIGLVSAIIFPPRARDGEPAPSRETAIALRAIWLAAVLVFITLRSPETITQLLPWAVPARGGDVAQTDAFMPVPAAQAPRTTGTKAAIDRIRQDFQRIEALGPDAHQHTIALEGFSSEGGEARVYFEGGRVAKIAARHMGESGKTAEDYYFRGNSLIFVFRRASHYDQPFGNVQRTDEDRFYFDRARMVRWRGSDQQLVARGNPAYAEQESGHLRFAAALRDAAKSRAPTLVAAE